ncbi:MAG: thioredoxin domain-containing protein [Chitinophagaceae bacterium]
MHKFSNKLINETSPYLLQHSHNPVNWYPWGHEALQKAKIENKPILVSIGYSACHWCHVMERESFEDENTAALMNDNFINIKIDREERPDLDHIYMDAVQAMTGSGGWPLNAFLTPETKPFYGGTYFPPVRAFNRASWQETLQGVIKAFSEKRDEIEEQAENLTGHLIKSNSFGIQKPGSIEGLLSNEKLQEAFENLMKTADKEWGGFGKAPKFPQTFSIQYLLRYSHFFDNNEALEQALLSLDKMIEGGIYDQVAAGFARYSTDTEWLAPHFEKMLYDNALLIAVLSEAYQLTKKERYREVIDETMEFIRRELFHPLNGFYSALDADSEGEEGKFYVWEKEEVIMLLPGNDAAIFCDYYDISAKGNWEEKNILRIKKPLEEFATDHNIDLANLKELLKNGRIKLLEERNNRIRPLLDDKILLGWNALMNTACSKAFAATGNEEYRKLAIANMDFLMKVFSYARPGEFFHTWKNGLPKFPAFLDDYAFLIQALIHLHEITTDIQWLLKARDLAELVIENFSETETGFFFYTRSDQGDIIVRKKEVYDGAVPSGNAIMATVIYQLSVFFDNSDWKQRSLDMVSALRQAITRYPTSFGCWNCLLLEMTYGTAEIAITGKDFSAMHKELLMEFIPHKVLMASSIENERFALLAGKPIYTYPLIYVCKGFSCLKPVASVGEATGLIRASKRVN